MKSFSNERLNFFLQKVLCFLHFGSCKNCMSFANLVAEIYQKAWSERVLNKVSRGFLQQDSQSSQSLVNSKMQEAQNFLKKKFQCFIGERFHISFSHTHTHTHIYTYIIYIICKRLKKTDDIVNLLSSPKLSIVRSFFAVYRLNQIKKQN